MHGRAVDAARGWATMRGMLALALVALLAQRPDIIRTKDGQAHVGHIIDKTPTGYLFRDGNGATAVIPYDTVDDVSAGGDVPAVAPPPPVVPQPSMEAYFRRQQRAALTKELREMGDEWRDATLFGPIFKLVGATAAATVAIPAYGYWQSGYTGERMEYLGIAIGFGVVSTALFIWGGLQLRSRIKTLQEMPGLIAEKEAQLALLQDP